MNNAGKTQYEFLPQSSYTKRSKNQMKSQKSIKNFAHEGGEQTYSRIHDRKGSLHYSKSSKFQQFNKSKTKQAGKCKNRRFIRKNIQHKDYYSYFQSKSNSIDPHKDQLSHVGKLNKALKS